MLKTINSKLSHSNSQKRGPLGAAQILWKTNGTLTSESNQHRPMPSSMGRDELNLVDFPIGSLTYQQPRGADDRAIDELVFSVDSFEEEVGMVVPKKVTTRTSSRYGFPTPKEEELLVGLMLFCRLKNNFTSPRIHFRNSELLKVMGWVDNGRSRRQLRQGLDRLSGVKLKYENSWSTDDGQKYEKEFITGILDSYELKTAVNQGVGTDLEFSWVQWSAEVFADIQKGNVKELNTAEFFSLKLPLSRRMYRFLDKHLSPDRMFEMKLKTFAAHLGISETHHIGKIRERLKRPIDELQQLGTLISTASDTDRFHRLGAGDWLIRFQRVGSAITQQPQRPAVERTARSAATPKKNSIAARLVCAFYQQWSGNPSHTPSWSETKQAQAVIDTYGDDVEEKLLPQVIRLMKSGFPTATSFGATKLFWHEATKKQKTIQTQKAQKHVSRESDATEQAQRKEQQRRKDELRTAWDKLNEQQQQDVRDAVLQNCDTFVRTRIQQRRFDDPLVQLACLNELERRRSSQI